jgi:uncharacterized protein YacL
MKSITYYFSHWDARIERVLMVVIFLALIRTISEIFRLRDVGSSLNDQQLRMCASGALTAAIGLFIMVLLSFWSKHRISSFLGIITLILLFVIKALMG